MPKFSKKQVDGYFKAKARHSSIGGGTVANDAYNVAMFKITHAEYMAMQRAISDAFGLFKPSNAEARRILRG